MTWENEHPPQLVSTLILIYLTGGASKAKRNSWPRMAYSLSSFVTVPSGDPEGLIDSQSTSLVHPSQLPSEAGTVAPQISQRLRFPCPYKKLVLRINPRCQIVYLLNL